MRTKKSPERRQGRGTKDIGVLPQIPVAEDSIPVAPAHLGEKWKAAWALFWSSPFAQLVAPAQQPAVDRLFGFYEERERMDAFIRQEPMLAGSQGQPVVNPMYRQRTAVDAEIRQLEDRLGLNPRSGLQLGIQFSEAARSLEELNARIAYAASVEQGDEDDPRRVTETEAETEEAAVLQPDSDAATA